MSYTALTHPAAYTRDGVKANYDANIDAANANDTELYAALPLTATATLNFPSITAGGAQELTITVTGAATGKVALAAPDTTIEAGLVWSAYVSAADTVTVRLANVTAGAIDPAGVAWKAMVWP